MQMIEQSLIAVGDVDQKKLAEYAHKAEFDTIVGRLKFGRLGEWTKPRILFDQYRNVVGNASISSNNLANRSFWIHRS